MGPTGSQRSTNRFIRAEPMPPATAKKRPSATLGDLVTEYVDRIAISRYIVVRIISAQYGT